MNLVSKITAICAAEKEFEWRKWINEIPPLQFPSHWYVRIIPPFSTGIVRFMVCLTPDMRDRVSVYLDCYQLAGCMDGPYWEVYPGGEGGGDVSRCGINDTATLLEEIGKSLERTKREAVQDKNTERFTLEQHEARRLLK